MTHKWLVFTRLMNFIHVMNLHLYHIWKDPNVNVVNYEYAIADDIILSKLHIGSIPVQHTSHIHPQNCGACS